MSPPCAADFGFVPSDTSLFIAARSAHHAAALRSPRLCPGQRYCLRTKPRCGARGQVRYLCVGHPDACSHDLLPLLILDDQGDELVGGLTWSNTRGCLVEPNGCLPATDTPVVLAASRGHLTCVYMRAHTGGGRCRWFANLCPHASTCCGGQTHNNVAIW